MPAQHAPEYERERRGLGGSMPAQAASGRVGADAARPGRAILARRPYVWFILPALLAYGAIFVYPTIRAFYLSFFDWAGYGPIGDFVGFKNFRDALTSSRFHHAATNSAKLFAVIFVLQNTISLGLAVMLNRRSPMTHVYRVIIFLPQIMSAVATGIIWILMLDPIIGIVNPVLHDVGLGSLQREWQADPAWAMKTVYLVQFWQWNGMAVVLYLAGLQNVPEDLRHAALVDGAKPWQVFRDVTFPMLAPAFTIVTVLSFILIFRAFDLIYVLGGPGGAPDGATLVIGVLIYSDAFGTSVFSNATRFSFAMSEGITLFVFLAGVSALLLKGLGRREDAVTT
ncbi:MAG TPA: sugar ABC transporter permease [Thermomicrobiales bacterium]|jgi:raffinose/stachyose/melibiose transport system permease protein